VLQDEALLLRKQRLLQKSEPRLLQRQARPSRLLLQKGFVPNARANAQLTLHLINNQPNLNPQCPAAPGRAP
jgi:hypothetical protein